MKRFIDVTFQSGSPLVVVAHKIINGFGFENSKVLVTPYRTKHRWHEPMVVVEDKVNAVTKIVRISVSAEPFGDYHLVGSDKIKVFVKTNKRGFVLVKNVDKKDIDNECVVIATASVLCSLIAPGYLLRIAE
jgi:hypothetical protein